MARKPYEFIPLKGFTPKPRKKALTEVRIPYYASVVTLGYIEEVLDTWSEYFDGFKFACGTMRLIDRAKVKKIIDMCHDHDVYVSTGGFVERVVVDGSRAVDSYFEECKALGFDVIEISSGFADISVEDQIAMVRQVKRLGMRPKPEITMMHGAGAGTHIVGYKPKMKPIDEFLKEAKAHIKAGADLMQIESEGLTEDLPPEKWRVDVIKRLVKELGYEVLMFEAADPEVFKWYLKNVSKDVNLFIDHTQITEFNVWRYGLWGDPDIWKGKKVSYKK